MDTSKSTAQKAIIIGCGIAGPVVAIFLQRAGITAEIYESRREPDDYAGAFLQVSSNGLDVLRTLGVDRQITADGFPCPAIVLYSGKGKKLGKVANGARAGGDAISVVVKRGALQGVLREEAVRSGIKIEFGKKLRNVETGAAGVVAHFEDGSQASGDFLVGADGIHSLTRRLMLPNGPQPQYTGLIGYGGFTNSTTVAPTPGEQHMIFGKRAFFGYLVKRSGDVWWFNNLPQQREPARGEVESVAQEALKRRMAEAHREDPSFVAALINSSKEIGSYPIYDLPSLPTWHKGRMVLVGDSAHATSPHAGQGASMALEDAVVLAKCLRDVPNIEEAFVKYEGLRKARVEKLVKRARRTGNSKAITNPVGIFMRDLLMPIFIKLLSGSNESEWIYTYKVDWNARVA